MDSDALLEYVVSNMLCYWQSKSKEMVDEMKYENPELYAFINQIVEDRRKEIEEIDKNDPEYISARDEALENIPKFDVSVYSYASRKFDLEWIKNSKSHGLKR